ncbi:MAG: hypothetical protein ACLQPD_24880 [Desulfomonilaceae bacterium]
MKEIEASPHYRVEVDTAKNRLYLSLFGDVLTDADVAGMLDGVQTAIDLLKPGFTAVGDFTGLNLLGLPDISQEVQRTLFNGGLRKVASVWSREGFAKIVVDSSARKVNSGHYSEKRKVFTSRVEAEVWLDE